tara:strand:+ start:161 stop:379 length:219 start_codon:yes stop_codon:yes gene_type:complete
MNNKEWYEIAISWSDGGTETIKIKESLTDAIDYAKNSKALHGKYVDFLFIDRWYLEKGNAIKYEQDAIIINK